MSWQGSWFAACVVNFITGFVRLYESERDVLDDQPAFSGCVRVPTVPRESYVQEILAFLERGHSLLNANCRCRHGLDAARCAELGISESGTGVRSGGCRLGSTRLFFSGTEICNELGVSSVSVTDKTGKSVLESLESEAQICCKHDALRNEPCYSFVYPIERVTCSAELLQLVEQSALGVTAGEKMQVYAGFESDLRELGARGEIYYFFNSESKRGVGFKRQAAFGGAVDADIMGLWKQAGTGVSGRGGREIERELYSLGIQATKVASAGTSQLPLKRAKKAIKETAATVKAGRKERARRTQRMKTQSKKLA